VHEDYRRHQDLCKATLPAGEEFKNRDKREIMIKISDELRKELEIADQTNDNDILAKITALGLFFHSDFWA
jgi:hypothetical protein